MVLGLRQLNLHAVHSVHAVDEENGDEDEGDLQAVLQLRDERVFAYESEQLALEGKGQWHNERHEDSHLKHEEGEDLSLVLLA